MKLKLILAILASTPLLTNAATLLYSQDFQAINAGVTNPDGWDGATRTFGADPSTEGGTNDRALIATGAGNYTTKKDIGIAVAANTLYTLTLDAGMYSSTAGNSTRFIYGLGTVNGTTFTQFASPSITILTQPGTGDRFFGSGNETALTAFTFTTGAVVSGDNLMINLRAEDVTGTTFGGWDSITLTSDPVPEPSSLLLLGVAGLALVRRRR